MKNENAPYTPSSSCKLIVIFVAILIIIEVTVVEKWEKKKYSVVSSSVSGFQVSKKSVDVLIGMQKLRNQQNTDKNNHTAILTTNSVIDQAKEKTSEWNPIDIQQETSERNSTDIQKELERRLRNATDKKVILVWIPMFGVKSAININSSNCGNCELTYDRGRISDKNVGAVVFHFDALRANNMPPTRNLNQLYIYWDMESTATLRVVRGHSLQFEDKFKFNATMTYRRDSAFYGSYKTDLSAVLQQNTLDELLKMKTKSAVAIVSNCGYTPGARTRMKMLRELMGLGINMEGFGGCFKGGRFASGQGRGSEGFLNEVRKYKFYFSFENSRHCKDYITEKFFSNALLSPSVPVVWGAKKVDYEAVAPPGSFIFAEDFASMKDLAEYLKYLMGNDTAYLEYLRWVTMKPSEADPQYGRAGSWCQICRTLHGINIDDMYNSKYNKSNPKRPLFTDGIAQRTIPHLIDWFYGEDNPECFQR